MVEEPSQKLTAIPYRKASFAPHQQPAFVAAFLRLQYPLGKL